MFDVIVVGAGPGGSIAAALLAKQGCRTLLLDKAKFPRDKICGDGVSWSCIRLLSGIGVKLDIDIQGCYFCDQLKVVSPRGYEFIENIPPHNNIETRTKLIEIIVL